MEDNFSSELKVNHRKKNFEAIICGEDKLWKVKENFVF